MIFKENTARIGINKFLKKAFGKSKSGLEGK